MILQDPLYTLLKTSRAERIEKLVKITYARAKYSDWVLRSYARVVVPDNIRIPVFRESVYYTVALIMGSRRHQVKLLLDTGGGLIWTQCLPYKNWL